MLKVWNVFAHLHHVLPDHLRHVPHALGPHRQRALVRAVEHRHLLRLLHGHHHRRVRRAHRVAPAALRSEGASKSVLSREAAFVVNNWAFLGIMVFILVATTFPRISEWLLDQKSTVGPTFYNAWIPPAGSSSSRSWAWGRCSRWRKTSPSCSSGASSLPIAAGARRGDLAPRARQTHSASPRSSRPIRIYEGFVGTALAEARQRAAARRRRPLRVQRRRRRPGVRARHPRAATREQESRSSRRSSTWSPRRAAATAATSSTSASS